MVRKVRNKSMKRRRPARVGPPTERDLEEATRKLQGMYRARTARRRMRLLLRSVYEKVYDADTGAYFYHNTHTGDVGWEAPKLLGGEPFDDVIDNTVSPHEAITAFRSLAKHWEVILDESSSEYYYHNHSTGETTWDKPDIVQKLQDATEERDEMLGPDWEEIYDTETNGYVFRHKQTKDTQEDPPKVDFRKTPEEKARAAKENVRLEKRLAKREARLAAKRQALIDAGLDPDAQQDEDEEVDDSSTGDSHADTGSSGSESDDSTPPEGIAVGDDGVPDGGDSSDSQSVYISSDPESDIEQEDDDDAEMSDGSQPRKKKKKKKKKKLSKRELKRLKQRRAKRKRQKENHLEKLEDLELAPEIEQLEYEARIRIKRCLKKRRVKSINLMDLQLKAYPSVLTSSNKRFAPLQTKLDSLNLSFNNISEIPGEINLLRKSLTTLLLHTNEIVKLPSQLFYCTELKELDLRNNRLLEIPREKGNMQILREMNIWEIGIETLQKLEILRLDRNQLSILPDEVGAIESLKILTVRTNRLTAVTESSLAGLSRLTRLDLSENALSSLPERVFCKLVCLEVFSIANNSLNRLPHDFGEAKSLRVFDASRNHLEALPDSFMALQKLEVLNLKGNSLTELPQDWASDLATSLRVVDIAHNEISRLPESFAHCNKLEHLNLSHNRISPRLPREVANLMQKLRSLDASFNNLTEIGFVHFSKMENLVKLNLEGNSLRAIAKELLYNAPSLTELILAGNKLTELPETDVEQGGGKLQYLDLCDNEIAVLPKTLFSVQDRIQTLLFSGNRFKSLPVEIGLLNETLRRLEMDNCRLKVLPSVMSRLTNLRSLSACNNLLSERPKMLETLPNLQHWKLGFNPIVVRSSKWGERRKALRAANVLSMSGKREEAIDSYTKILEEIEKDTEEHDDDFVERETILEELLRKRGVGLVVSEKYKEGHDDLTKALSMHDNPKVLLLYHRAVAKLRGLNDPTGALCDVNQVIKMNAYLPAYKVRSKCYLSLGHYHDALQDAEFVLDSDIFDEDAYLSKGLALEQLQKLSEALFCYKKVIELCTGNQKNSELEENEGKGKAKFGPRSPVSMAYYRSGIIFRHLEKHREAVANFETAIEVLHGQYEKAQKGSHNRKKLFELLRLAMICKSSALCSMNRAKKGTLTFREAKNLVLR